MTSNLELLREEIASLENLWRKRQTAEGLAALCLHGDRSDYGSHILKKIVRLKEKERQLLGSTSNGIQGVPYVQWALCATDSRLDYAIYLIDDDTLAGRSLSCAIAILAVPTVSRRHAVLRLVKGVLYLEDLHSTNGTQVNGWRVRRRLLADGDHVVLADVSFIVVSSRIAELSPPEGNKPNRNWSSRARVIKGRAEGSDGHFLAIGSAGCR